MRYLKLIALAALAIVFFAPLVMLAFIGVAYTCFVTGGAFLGVVIAATLALIALLAIHVVKSAIFTLRMLGLAGWRGDNWIRTVRRPFAWYGYAFMNSPPSLRAEGKPTIYWPGMRKKICEQETKRWAEYDADNNRVPG